ncbi:MAG: hypothetical protein ACRD23_04095, partial [Terriglobales bacterium]
FEIPSKALRCSPSAVWLSPDIPEQVRVSFRSGVRNRLIWLELKDRKNRRWPFGRWSNQQRND